MRSALSVVPLAVFFNGSIEVLSCSKIKQMDQESYLICWSKLKLLSSQCPVSSVPAKKQNSIIQATTSKPPKLFEVIYRFISKYWLSEISDATCVCSGSREGLYSSKSRAGCMGIHVNF